VPSPALKKQQQPSCFEKLSAFFPQDAYEIAARNHQIASQESGAVGGDG